MAEKVFLEQGSFRLISDERDIMLPLRLTKEVQKWCLTNNIKAEQNQKQAIIQSYYGVTLWRIKDEQQRAWFILRWS
jgi:hypothetical protein